MIDIVRGSKTVLRWGLKVDGSYLRTLPTATRIAFAVKDSRDDLDVDSCVLISGTGPEPGAQLALDTPETGWIQVTLKPSDTSSLKGIYVYALQVEWSDDDKLEFTYGDGLLRVKPDVVR